MRGTRWLAAVVAGLLVSGGSVGAASAGGKGGGGTLRYGLEAESQGLNPTTNAWAVSAIMMGRAVFDPLFWRGTDDEWHPYLAESATPNADFTAWDITLRPGIQFHDGTPLTSEAIKANLEASLADPLVSLAVGDFFDPETPVEIVDELTARIHMSGPNAHLPQYLFAQIGYIASPTWLAAADQDPDLNQEPVGTGPFEFESRVQDSSTTFVRNDDYWGGKVKLDAIEFVIQTDPARRADQLIAGELDAMHTSDPQTIELLRGEDGLQRFEQDTGEEGFAMINAQNPPFDDVRARRALTLATPRRKVLEIVERGITTPANSMFHPSLPFHNPRVKQQADKPASAKKLAKQYCADHPDGCTGGKIKMSFKYPGPSVTGDLQADVLVEGWSSAFDVDREQVLQDDYIIQVATGNYNVVVWRQFGADDPDGDFTWLDCRNVSPQGALALTFTRFCNDEIQSKLLAQRESADQKAQAETWKEVSELVNEAYVYVFFGHTRWQVAARDSVKNVVAAKLPDGKAKAILGNGSHSLWQMSLGR